MEKRKLVALFRKLGANEPETWASSQIEEGIPQVARFLFLRQAWRLVVDEADASWIDRLIQHSEADPDAPYAGTGHALTKLRTRGATNEGLTDLVRGMQAELLFSFCQLLDDPGEIEPEAEEIGWALVQVDEEGNVLAAIEGLHESVLETDPTGREMRPRTV